MVVSLSDRFNDARAYLAEHAARAGVRSFEGGDFVTLDGVSWQQSDVVYPIAAIGDNPTQYAGDRAPLVGKYATNNSHVVFVSPDGQMHLGFQTNANMALLREAGYEEGVMSVPMSWSFDRESLLDEKAQAEYERLKAEAVAGFVLGS